MSLHRREFLHASAALALAAPALPLCGAEEVPPLIVDVHQHLWDLSKLKLPWLDSAPEVLRQTYYLPEYAEATRGLNVKAVYMEVDVAKDQLTAEADHVLELSRSHKAPTIAAVIGGRPEAEDFATYLQRFKGVPELKGVRRVLHSPETPKGYCLEERFVAGVKLLGKQGLSFDLCMRPTELDDALKLTELCPDTRFVVDHCGNADVLAFGSRSSQEKAAHKADAWKAAMERLAKRPNTICKISGIIARLPKGGDAEALAPIVNHCLDAFGSDRVVFGSDWPVCLLGAPLNRWVEMLAQIVRSRPQPDRQALWSANAIKHYGLKL
jgi:predicted TIM-barrel fold metal-dependent hydrolase